MYIDTHSHIYLQQFEEDCDEVIQNAIDRGVIKTLLPNIDSQTIQDVFDLSQKFPHQCYPMVGLHPCSVKESFQDELDILSPFVSRENVVAIGEIGVDLYWDKTFKKEQQEAFELQIQWALEHDLPIVIHSRDSLDVTIETVTKFQNGRLRGVFHCFNGTEDQGKAIQDLGFYMGIGGVITFKNAGVDKTIRNLKLDKMILETDAPYLTPTPHRGKRNEPAYIPLIAQKLAEIFDLPVDEVGKITTQNANELFRL